MTRDVARRGASRSEHQCLACKRPFHTCWKFQPGADVYCGLCGVRVLHLIATQPVQDGDKLVFLTPPRKARDVCRLYWPSDNRLQLVLFWALGTEETLGQRSRRIFPRVDFEKSWARFSVPQVGDVAFHLEKIQEDVKTGVVLVRLVLAEGSPAPQELPTTGAWGSLRVSCDPVAVDRRALLLPPPRRPFDCDLADSSLRARDAVLRLHEQGPAVRLPMRLSASVPVWALGCEVEVGEQNFADTVQVDGFTEPALLGPEAPLPFELVVDSSRWLADRGVPVRLTWKLLGLPPETYEGTLVLVGGPRLHVDDSGVRALHEPVQLGQVKVFPLPLSVRGGDAGNGTIKVARCEAHCEGDWLSVLYPTREQLRVKPLAVESHGSQYLQVQVDTTRLDRVEFASKRLAGRIELIDARRIKKTVPLEVPMERPKELRHWVAFDWGTTNSCAAYSTDINQPPVPVFLDEEQVRNPEQFPSDVYFVDLRAKENPVFLLGHKAADRRSHRECSLRSIKRKFQFHEQVTVMDERGAQRTYPLSELVYLVLHRLVCQAEDMGRSEVRRVGFTFPTKWPPRVRRRFQQVVERLRQQLQAERRDCEVYVEPPEIDEANAVAIELLTAGRKLPAGKFYLIAYDFGGGTVDTCVLEVENTDVREPRTRYVGIGGRRDFGGDEVTRAVLMLLCGRLTAALQRREPSLVEIPLVPGGQDWRDDGRPNALRRDRLGRSNWDVLWKVAESVKIDLCATRSMAARVNPVLMLNRHSRDIVCRLAAARPANAAAPTRDEAFMSLEDMGNAVSGGLTALSDELKLSLDEVCGWKLDDLDGSNNHQEFTVRERVEDTLNELKWQCDANGIRPHLVVLAGGGCRLPLVLDLFQATFGTGDAGPELLFREGLSKQCVAHGLAKYLDMRHTWGTGARLARSVDVIHHDLGLRHLLRVDGGGREEFVPLARAGTRFGPTWHPVRFGRDDVVVSGGRARLSLFVNKWGRGKEPLGYFDLARPDRGEEGDPPCVAAALPLEEAVSFEGFFRMRGPGREDGQGQMELHVMHQGKRFGCYRLGVADADPEVLLQE